ncbi:MAG: hypothetical protein IJ890_06270 [Clostridia bacterium]|nr:hypothetical protein [Clostridia bacterium]
MNKKEPKIQAEIVISLYDDMFVEISYSQDLTLNERIALITQALQQELEIYNNMTKLDENKHLSM